MRAPFHHLIAWGLVLLFGGVSVGGKGLHLLLEHGGHSHAGHGHGSRGVIRCDAGAKNSPEHRCCQHHAHGKGRPATNPAWPAWKAAAEPHDHDHCLVCQFYAQAQQVSSANVMLCVPMACDVVRVTPHSIADARGPLAYRSRAPPTPSFHT